ncbi:hypothetical protein LCGC14_0622760 [marine sediment metagenome]|uniref:Uncharacterized protein n=1 Tax=marine sediment metagenome TaxID=412755 RepID=A0A0F9R4F9_9ZZZZ
MRFNGLHNYIIIIGNSLILYSAFLTSRVWKITLIFVGLAILGFYACFGIDGLIQYRHEKQYQKMKELNKTENML